MCSLDNISAFYSDNSNGLVCPGACQGTTLLEEEVMLPSDSFVSDKSLGSSKPIVSGTSTTPVPAVRCGEANGDWNNRLLKVSSMLLVYFIVNLDVTLIEQ